MWSQQRSQIISVGTVEVGDEVVMCEGCDFHLKGMKMMILEDPVTCYVLLLVKV